MLLETISEKLEKDPNFYTFIAFICFGFILYLNSFSNTWTFDDYFVVLDNPDVRSLADFVRNSYPGRPLRELSAMLDYHLFGFSPAGWHIQNILWHSLNAWLVFILCSLLSDSRRINWFASALFLVHPLHVEVVAQASHRKDSLALFFMLAVFVFYLLYRKNGEKKYLLIASFAMLLSFFAKENALVLPLVLLVFEVVWGGRLFGGKIVHKQLLLLPLAVFLFVLPWYVNILNFPNRAESLLISNNYFDGFNVLSYLLAILNAWGYLFLKLVLPYDLAVNYVLEVPGSIFTPRVMVTCLIIIIYFGCLILFSQRNSYLFFSLLWLGLLYLPTSNLLPVNHLAADRYMYAPSVGFFMATSYLINKFIVSRPMHTIVTILVVLSLSLLTVKQNTVWENNATLWTHSMEVNPRSARAISNSGRSLYAEDDDLNLEMQLRAARINPKDPFVQMEIGEILERRGDVGSALEHFQKARELFLPLSGGMYKNIFNKLQQKLPDEN